jgi:hypothetical protein
MGLSLHYSGEFNEKASLVGMINEVRDFLETLKWPYAIYDKEFPNVALHTESYNNRFYGISFDPPQCETVYLSFLSNKKMSCPANMMAFGNIDKSPEKEYLYMLSVKTQLAGVEIHKCIVELLKYLYKQNYFAFIKVTDEGHYWETGNEAVLTKTFARYTRLIDDFTTALECTPKPKGESYEKYFFKIMDMVQKKLQQ